MFEWPRGQGEMAGRIREFDWAATPLGPVAGWPQSLRTVIDLMLGSPGVMSLLWGDEAIHIYNDGFTELLCEHPAPTLGRSAFETFARARAAFADQFAAGMRGCSARLPEQRYPVLRDGDLQEAVFEVDYIPVRGEVGTVVGVLWSLNEITGRKKAEAALRRNEERFRQFAASSSDALWIREATTLDMEYVSPAIQQIYGVPSDTILGDVRRWAALIVPEDRDAALEHLDRARGGEAVTHEFRILRSADGAFRWICNTDFPLLDEDGRVQRIGGIAEDVTEAKLAAEHSAVLLGELQHRVRNIMAMIRTITARTGEDAASVPEYAALMDGRFKTLARVQALLTRAADAGVGIIGILRDELEAQAQHEGQYALDGPDLLLSPKTAEVLTLAIHELTTNALKHGALASPRGRVTARWATFAERGATWLGFDWTEEGAPERLSLDPAASQRRGFGAELIEGRVPYELGGRGKLVIEPGGARCRLEFPLQDDSSVLETDAPQRTTIAGGSIDMAGEGDLSGRRVLVIEDDYYLASDTARALQGVGAEVLGPCPTEAAARDAMDRRRPDAAVVDINLGSGPSFKLAQALKDLGIPFVFTTGYDPEVIPPGFGEVARLQKPIQLRQIVTAVAKLLGDAAQDRDGGAPGTRPLEVPSGVDRCGRASGRSY